MTARTRFLVCTALALLALTYLPALADSAGEFAPPPKGAIVLFDGRDTSAWQHADGRPCDWRVEDGALEVTPRTGNLLTKEKFGNFRLHLEFNVPSMPNRKGQGRGNSGVHLHGLYEIQILDSVDNPTYHAGGCGSIYLQKDPDRNVARKPGEWQSYDITFRAPRFGPDGAVAEKPRVTVVWNGVRVHDNVEILRPTHKDSTAPMVATGPISLQDHGCRVRFRNIWVVPVKSVK